MDIKSIKFKVGTEAYPTKLLKDLDYTTKQIAKSTGQIPQTIKDWRQQQSFLKFEQSSLSEEIDKMNKKLDQMKEKYVNATREGQKAMEQDIAKTSKSLDNLERKLTNVTRMQNAVTAHINAQKSAGNVPAESVGGKFIENMMNSFAAGGVAGVGRQFLKSGLGKLGMGGLVAYGLYKTYDWVQEKSQLAREYNRDSLSLTRRNNLSIDLSRLIGTNNIGANERFSNIEMLRGASSLANATGSTFLGVNPINTLNALSSFTRGQGLSFDETSVILQTGQRGGFISDKVETNEMNQYLGLYASAMAKGVDLGFNKNERIGQLIRLQQMSVKDGADSKESFKKMLGELNVLESTGLKSLRGEGAIEAMQMSRGFLQPSSTTTPLFASLAMSGIISSDMMKSAKTRLFGTGVSESVFNNLFPATQYAMLQKSMQAEGLPAFKEMYDNLKKRTGSKLAPNLMMEFAGVSPENYDKFAILLSKIGDMKPEEFAKQIQDLKEPQKALAENTLALKDEMSTYYKGQSELNGSMIALRSVIDMETNLRKLEMSLTGKFNTSKMTRQELEYAAAAGVPGAQDKLDFNYNSKPVAPGIGTNYNKYTGGKFMETKIPLYIYDKAKKYSQKHNVPLNETLALMQQESSFDPNAVSSKGASGLMQLMPSTAKELGVTNIFDVDQNIEAGIKYYSQLKTKYKGDRVKAFGAYNAGPKAMDEYLEGRRALSSETLNHMNETDLKANALQDLNINVNVSGTVENANVDYHKINDIVSSAINEKKDEIITPKSPLSTPYLAR